MNRTPIPAGRVNPESPPRLEEVINKALEKDRKLRYHNASELRADLQRLKRDTESANAVPTRESDRAAGVRPWWRRGPALAVGVLALAALIVAGMQLVVLPGRGEAIDSIAVLPFVNGSGDPDTEYLSDGITESLINNLSQLPSLRVAARSTVFRYKGQETDPQKIGQDLRVRAVLSAEAYQLYLKGRYYWNKRSPEALQKSIEYFNRAVDADPAYALAYAGLADTYNMISFFNMVPPREAMPKAKAAAAKALEIDGNLAEAHISLAYASFTYEWDWPAATRHFDQAIGLNREAVMNHAYYPFYLTVAGRSEEAVSVAKARVGSRPGFRLPEPYPRWRRLRH